MEILWVILCVALDGLRSGFGLPLGMHDYPQDDDIPRPPVTFENILFISIPAIITISGIVILVIGCIWCYNHKDCKLFSSSCSSQPENGSRRYQPDSGFSEPANNNISEDNNNGPISLREMQNIANNNAAAYIVSENEERNRTASRESVVRFEPLPGRLGPPEPLVPFADWFEREDFSRDRLQYLREIGRGWFGRIVHGEVDNGDASTSSVAVKILNQDATAEDKARFLSEARLYRDALHDHVLSLMATSLREDPWILMFDLYQMTLQQYLVENRPKMAVLNASGAPLRLITDVADALTHLHSMGFTYGSLNTSTVFIRGSDVSARAVLGRYADVDGEQHNHWSADVYDFGLMVWAVMWWGSPPAPAPAPSPAASAAAPCPYPEHLYRVTQLCTDPEPSSRPEAARLLALVSQLVAAHRPSAQHDPLLYADFEARWQRLQPNCAATAATSPRKPRTESLTNLHGSLEDVRNMYLAHDERPAAHCHDPNLSPGRPGLDSEPPCPRDLSDDSVDPWLKDIVAGSLDDVSYYRDVSDVIKNLDNILNSEKTSSSESSHQASPSRDNLSLDCKREPPVQSCLVKSPGIGNFQNVLEMEGEAPERAERATCVDEAMERDAVCSLSHSFERHSDSASQSTLENLTPDTPNKNIESICEEPDLNDAKRTCNVEMPKVNVEIVVPKLKDLCLAIRPSISDEQPKEDCTAPCDRSDNSVLTKSVSENVPQDNELNNIDLIKEFIRNESVVVLEHSPKKIAIEKTSSETNSTQNILNNELETNKKSPEEISDVITTSEHVVDSIIAEAKRSLSLKMKEDLAPLDILQVRDDDTLSLKNGLHKEYMPEILPTSLTAVVLEQYELKDKLAREEKSAHDSAISERADAEDTSAQISFNTETLKVNDEVTDKSFSESFERSLDTASTMPIGNIPEDVQNANDNDEKMADESDHTLTENLDKMCNLPQAVNIHNDSTVYMDLINTTASEIKKNDTMNENVKNVITNCVNADINDSHEYTMVRNDSTVYMELPALIQDTQNFIHLERLHNDMQVVFDDVMTASTPKNDNEESKVAQSVTRNEVKSGRLTPDYGPGVTLTRLEQKCVADYMSPCDSPTKSHPTDTYDENSSVVLGSFENCSLELFKGIKSDMDIPKEEFLAFSSNFTEMNLETPSPLRDGNFLNEVPDIEVEDSKSVEISKDSLENTATEKVKSPSTPPNSPGIFLASTSQNKYIVDIDLSSPNEVVLNASPSVQEAVDLHQIELQMASKLAMAENENNMNIEYSGPLVEEPEEEPESYLAGNGGLIDEREDLGLDEDCMKALRNELELKLPLAQVASIEPTEEAECSEPVAEACWAPELVVSYPGALSPIAEETLRQLSAYDNDVAYVPSTRTTDSSESYLEPCNNSTDDVTELTANAASNATYTLDHVSVCDTYTLHKDANTSREITMSADSLNGSPSHAAHAKSPDDATYNKQDREPTLERISQVSPLLLSPTTDTSAPETTDNATCVYTLSKTTPPTDAKSSKPSDTQCLSKATSIDSWCSNDTLFNVEDNFDDLAGDVDAAAAAAATGYRDDDSASDSTHTLTHHDDADDDSHCSTYIVHDDHSQRADTFTPDSITPNGTYTKLKTENKNSPLVVFTKSDADSSEANSQAKDLAYGTLTTGLATHSSCTTDLFSIKDDIWRLPQPELVRRSPIADGAMNLTPPTSADIEAHKDDSPQLHTQHSLKKMDSVEITCLRDDSHEDSRVDAPIEADNEMSDSPNYHMRNMACSVQSTPLLEATAAEEEGSGPGPLQLPSRHTHTPDNTHMSLPNFQTFMHSAELRPQDMSSMSVAESTGLLLEGESKTSNTKDSLGSPNYTSFEESAVFKPQDVHSSQSEMSAISSNEEFRMFENSVRGRPQDLSDPENASSSLLKSEGTSTMFLTNSGVAETDANGQISNTLNTALRAGTFSPDDSPRVPDLSNVPEMPGTSTFFDEDEEQPHSIIITHNLYKENANHTFDSHENETEINHTYDSHTMRDQKDSGSVDDGNKTQSSPDNNRDCTRDTSSTNPTHEDDTKKSPAATEQSHFVSENKMNGVSHNYATVNYISENFEELTESNVDTNSYKDSEIELKDGESSQNVDNNHQEVQKELISQVDMKAEELKASPTQNGEVSGKIENEHLLTNGNGDHVGKMSTATEDFLLNEKKYCQLNAYLPILGDIRFTGPTSEIMSTSFTQDSPTEDTPPNGDSQSPSSAGKKQNGAAAEILKEWDSDSESDDSNSSSGEFIWKQREGGGGGGASDGPASRRGDSSGASDASGATDGSGSEGDEVAFVPSSWDCRAEPAKTSLRSAHRDLPAESKKRVVFKRQKYHCVYEYPREAADVEPAPHLYSYSSYEYEPELAEAAELSYSQLYGHPLDMFQLRSGVSFSTDYDDDFFISSSARPFESLGTMSSQFFPGHALKSGALDAEPEDAADEFPPPPSPLLTELALAHSKSPSLDFTTPDSGVEDVTPGSLSEEARPPPEGDPGWAAADSASSSASGSPAAPAASPSPSPGPGAGPEALGGLRHTRDRLKLDLPASPCLPSPSPRHARVFTFVLDKPRARVASTPLVMTDDTPRERAAPLLIPDEDRFAPDPPTFSTFGKGDQPAAAAVAAAAAAAGEAAAEAVKGEGTVLDSGDEDSGIESSAKASLDRNTNVS